MMLVADLKDRNFLTTLLQLKTNYSKGITMNNFITIALLFSLTSIIHAECRCVKHSPQDHRGISDTRSVGKEVGKNMPRKVAGDIKDGAHETIQKIENDMTDAKNKVQNSKTVQSAKEAVECMCDKSKCLAHNVKQKTEKAIDATKELASKAGDFTKEVVSRAGSTIKETAYKVGNDLKEGAMEVKDDVARAKERAKRS